MVYKTMFTYLILLYRKLKNAHIEAGLNESKVILLLSEEFNKNLHYLQILESIMVNGEN